MREKRVGTGSPTIGKAKPSGGGPPATVDEYLAALAAEEPIALGNLRAEIRSSAPPATESIAYGIPSYTYRGYLVGIGAQKDHLAFYVSRPPRLEPHATELGAFDVGKGCIRFPASRPVPEALVRKLGVARVAENEARAAR
ncbi:MAG: DUF1801 domain-containing protein [Thermoplasmata archaeon]|nr:DUF1801 domain-containing protein [Thermoplasmata archaeon]